MKVSQTEKVKNYLLKGNSLTQQSALTKFKVKNLRARVTDIRNEGYNVLATPVSKASKKVRYTMN